MKITHVVYSLEIGGAEMLVAQLCRLQRQQGHEVAICAYSNLGPLGELLRAEGFDVYVPGVASPAITAFRYFRRFRRERPDVVHCHNIAPTLQAAPPARLAGVRRVISTRHSLVAPPYNRTQEIKFSLITRFCDSVTGICEITCENLRGAPLANRKKIVRIYNGAQALERVEPLEGGEFTLLFVGRLAAVKNLQMLLRATAAAIARVPGLRLWIVGDGSVCPELEQLANELGINAHVTFWGQQMDTAQFFSSADLFVMSSTSEGLPMSLLQAMSLELPTLATDVGGLAEIVRRANCGSLVGTNDHAAMAEAIVRLAGDPESRRRYGANALAGYLQEFTLERMAEGYMQLYGA